MLSYNKKKNMKYTDTGIEEHAHILATSGMGAFVIIAVLKNDAEVDRYFDVSRLAKACEVKHATSICIRHRFKASF